MNFIKFVAAFASASHAYMDLPTNISSKDFTEKKFQNLVDHFNYQDPQTYDQRYFECDDFFDKENGPIFVYICGEYTCSVRDDRLFPFMVGAKHKAKLVALEHRFYGDSIPQGNLELANLKYLSSEQALADLAYFITFLNADKTDRKVVVVGGSYPGALSAWFREKYPQLAVASWSSSGVVYPEEDFWKFDQQIYDSTVKSNQICPRVIQDVQKNVTKTLTEGSDMDIKNMMNILGADSDMDHGDFAFYVSDIFVESVQYGNRTGLCKVMMDVDKAVREADFLKGLEYVKQQADLAGVAPGDYDRNLLKNEEPSSSATARAWTYQYCSEFGWYQTPSHKIEQAMRTQILNETYWKDMCNFLFPGVNATFGIERSKIQFSFHHTAGSNTIITNGVEDPWQWATELQPNEKINQVGLMADCEDCGHCADLYTPKDDDKDELKKVRDQIVQWIDDVLNDSDSYSSMMFLQ